MRELNLTMQQFLEGLKFEELTELPQVVQARLQSHILGEIDLGGTPEGRRQQELDRFKYEIAKAYAGYTRTVLLLTKCGCSQYINLPTARENSWMVPIAGRSSIVSLSGSGMPAVDHRKFSHRGQREETSGCRILEEQ